MNDAKHSALMQALGDVTYEDLIGDLERYGWFPQDAGHRTRYPEISMALVKAAMGAADECPVCLRRFVNRSGKHEASCSLAPLL